MNSSYIFEERLWQVKDAQSMTSFKLPLMHFNFTYEWTVKDSPWVCCSCTVVWTLLELPQTAIYHHIETNCHTAEIHQKGTMQRSTLRYFVVSRKYSAPPSCHCFLWTMEKRWCRTTLDVPHIEPLDIFASVEATGQIVGQLNVVCRAASHSRKAFSLLQCFQHRILSPA